MPISQARKRGQGILQDITLIVSAPPRTIFSSSSDHLDLVVYIACSTNVEVTMSFGGQSWPISNADFQANQLDDGACLGAFFEVSTGGSAPAWIVGDSFLVCNWSHLRAAS